MPIYYNEDEYNTLLSVADSEYNVVIPNEFFDDINKLKKEINLSKDSKHVSFAYGYLFLITYIYRYTKFHSHQEYGFTEQEIKKLLTISPDSYGKNSVNNISKRGGILERMGYIEKVKDYPVSYDFDKEENEFVFCYLSEIIEDLGDNATKLFPTNTKNRRVNFPVKMFEDRDIPALNRECNGTIFDVTYTTSIDIRVFIYCMVREELGLEAFYLYSFIKFKNGYYGNYWRRSVKNIVEDTGLSQTVVQSRLKELEQHGMISNTHEDFVVGANKNEMNANGYMTQEYYRFIKNGEKKDYRRGRVVSILKPEEGEKFEGKVGEATAMLG
ncbi:hypothetical protein [Bacillus manliponensis]|uniref:hypothetical protein n=1 Tax=Bacillus manliponensis TaxID=574376 RepID=UPI003515F068